GANMTAPLRSRRSQTQDCMRQDCQGVRIYFFDQCPRQDSNLRSRLRRPLLSPLSYGGLWTGARLPVPPGLVSGVCSGRPRTRARSPRPRRREHPPGDANLAPVAQGLGRVLVVDDDEVIRQLIAVNLTLEGFDVATAVDGQDCLDKVAAI